MLIIFFQKDAITYIYILTKLEFSTSQKYRKANITKYKMLNVRNSQNSDLYCRQFSSQYNTI